MDKVSTSGQMEDSTKEIMLTTKRSHMVFTHILMAAVTKETGKLVNSMERVSSLARKVFKEKENGRMVKDSIGLMRWKEDTISVDLVLEVIDLFTILT
jgi:urease gamma subunit